MATIYVDDKPYQVKDGQNLLQACLSLGFNLPYFCWHPAMHSVGACRQCAVKQFRDENDKRGRIVMACMTPATEGTRLSIDDADARLFRASIVELLMLNHPHDCPVCDEGGECHLQDMTVMTGHNYRDYRFGKRTYRNQYLGPFVYHEMNRCIQCYRCVRFYRDYAGGRDLNVFAVHDEVYFGRQEEGILESEFSGNLVEVCPTGVFTDLTLRQHYTRKWDLQTAPSVCVHCGLGCNTIPGERYGELRRIRNRFNSEVNGYFLCDRGRYGYEFVNSDLRIRSPLVRSQPEPALASSSIHLVHGNVRTSESANVQTVTEAGEPPSSGRTSLYGPRPAKEGVLTYLAQLLSSGTRAIGIGSPRASLEANFALRTLVGPDRFYTGMSGVEHELVSTVASILQRGPARTPSLLDVEGCDAVLILGEDVLNTAPRLALALRQTVRQRPLKTVQKMRIPVWNDAATREVIQDAKGPFFLATPTSTRLEDLASRTVHAAPDDLARLGFAVAQAIDGGAPEVEGLPEERRALVVSIAEALRQAERPLVISGTSCGSRAVVEAAANVAWSLCAAGRPAALSYVVSECNSLGLGLMGGGSLEAALKAAREGDADTVVILENDLYRRAAAAAVDELLGTGRHVVAIDSVANATTARAEVVLPAATFAEADGTLVSGEGRAQRFFQVFVPTGEVQESWRWLRDMIAATGRAGGERWQSLDDVIASLIEEMPAFAPIREAAPPSDFRPLGQKVPRQPHRHTGRTAMYANVEVSDPRPLDDPDSALAFSMEGYPGQPPPALIPRFWAPGWNSNQALNKFQSEVGGPLRGDPPGRRLIEPASKEGGFPVTGEGVPYFREIPSAFVARPDEWLVVPVYHIFGSDERSVLAPGIAERAPAPYLVLRPEDARSLQVEDGQEVELNLGGTRRRLPVRPVATLPAGVVGLPAGLPGLTGVALPTWGRIAAASSDEGVGGVR